MRWHYNPLHPFFYTYLTTPFNYEPALDVFILKGGAAKNRNGRCFPFGKHRPLSKEGRDSN